MKNFFSFRRWSGLALVALLGTGSVSAQMHSLYGVSFFDNQLLRIDTTTGAGSLIAPLSEPVSAYGLGFRGNRLYTFDPNVDRVREINPMTGGVSGAFDIGVGDLLGEGDIAFRNDGVGFLSSALTPDFELSNDLFRFDLDLGTSTRIGSTSVVLDGMTFVGDTLFGIGQEGAGTLYIVDQNTAALTPVGSLGVAIGSPFSALTVGNDGNLYAALNDRLFSVDRLTGAAMMLDPNVLDIGFSSISGLAPANFAPIPEPSTYAMAGVALCAAVCVWRRRKQVGQRAPTVAG